MSTTVHTKSLADRVLHAQWRRVTCLPTTHGRNKHIAHCPIFFPIRMSKEILPKKDVARSLPKHPEMNSPTKRRRNFLWSLRVCLCYTERKSITTNPISSRWSGTHAPAHCPLCPQVQNVFNHGKVIRQTSPTIQHRTPAETGSTGYRIVECTRPTAGQD